MFHKKEITLIKFVGDRTAFLECNSKQLLHCGHGWESWSILDCCLLSSILSTTFRQPLGTKVIYCVNTRESINSNALKFCLNPCTLFSFVYYLMNFCSTSDSSLKLCVSINKRLLSTYIVIYINSSLRKWINVTVIQWISLKSIKANL
jgi:hypothetical protein